MPRRCSRPWLKLIREDDPAQDAVVIYIRICSGYEEDRTRGIWGMLPPYCR